MRFRKFLIPGIPISILTVLLCVSILAPVWPLRPYDRIDLLHRLMSPSPEHWLGTDEIGRDILSRLIYGGRVSFLVSIIVVIFSLVVGVALGSFSGLMGGWVDELLMRLTDVFLAFPGFLLAIGLVAVLGPGLQNVILALVIIGWVSYARLVRGLTLKLRELDFVNASRSLGASSGRLLIYHILPNMLPAIVVQATFSLAGVILAESSLSFLGLGVQPPAPSWGSMLSDGKNHLLDAPHLTLFPGLAIFASVLAFQVLGDSLRDRLDPRLRG